MQNVFERSMKSMQQSWEQWQKMMSEMAFWPKTGQEAAKEAMTQWLHNMKSVFTSSAEAWNNFLNQTEETFSKMYKQSPMYSSDAEKSIQEAWEDMRKARETYQAIVKDSLEKIEQSVKAGSQSE
jgi:hypothetical protein